MTDSVPQGNAQATGFRTFLIADVRGYTVYTREQGDERAAQLASDFAAAVRDVVTTRDGFLLELRGDEALVVFESPRQALRAAVALQEKFKEVGLPRGVGIGLDAGEAIPIEGGYRGGALNLAARLCSQAAAGEILASEAVIHLAARIDGVEYVEGRTLHLKGYAEPVRAVEVAAPGRVRRGLSRRARRIRVGLKLHRRAIAAGAAVLLVGAAGVAIVLRPPTAPARIPTLADLPAGIAVIDAKTGKETVHIGISTVKEAVDATYASGNFWILNLEPLSFVQVDATKGSIVRQIASPFDDVGGYVADERNLWIADYAHPAIARIDIASGREVNRLDLAKAIKPPDEGFAGLALGDGSIWAAGKSRGQVFRIDPGNGRLQATIDDAGSFSTGFGDGFLWTGSFDGVTRIDSATNSATKTDVPGGHVASTIAVGGGFAWTADESKGVVYKIDRAGKIAGTIETGIGAHNVSFSDGQVWVANQDIGTVSGIDVVTGKVTTLTFGHPASAVAAGGARLLVLLGQGRTYEDRIEALTGKVARLFIAGYQFESGEPATEWSPEAFLIGDATCAKLANWVREAGGATRLQPEVAAAMPSISADGRTYTFQIRPGFAFSDASGEKVTAETFRYSIERALSPRLAETAPGVLFIDDIKGEDAFRNGTADHISGLVAAGDRLSITLVAPRGDLTSRLTLPFFCPVRLGTPIVPGGAVSRVSGPDGTVESLPSAGPYYLADRLNGEYAILKKNPNYGGSRKAAFDAIALREGINGGVAVERVDSKKWDGIVDLDDQIFSPRGELATRWGPASAAANAGDQRFHVVPDGGLWMLSFNASRPPFSDIRMRQAVSLAINRAAVADASGSEVIQVLPWNRFLGPPMNSGAAPSAEELRPDLQRARALLGTGVSRTLTLAVPSFCDECQSAGDRIASDLRGVGLQVEVQRVRESADVQDPFANFDMRLGAIWPDTPDRGAFLSQLLTLEVPSGWLPAPLQGVDKSLTRVSGAEREKRVTELAATTAEQVPAAVYGYSVKGAYFGRTVGCVQFWPTGELDVTALCPAS
ncbi:MAG: ABC transporter substrate-binding protein [Chloroflexota bacterium]|nr:ABC transporter substrate-binding protein [Chloroflexota bacterium]